MSRFLKWLLRVGGLGLIGAAALGGLSGPYPIILGIAGLVLFFAAGPT
ncbi:hypothetical protein [Desulfoscipio geothermicus]|uniref:Uncharacterized protein n=1 Tax=Desulfoscipio geothermicus DSM 3669 TaxID=1121426 RepID=A0A1I6DP91_9FIRM|nr:hypothetical protein [Desulfoscipio geothermicus]SFR07264.1 hypothetical protein SAMN05660706_11473 [Desulfoscipio geothermicus DSM 3669]